MKVAAGGVMQRQVGRGVHLMRQKIRDRVFGRVLTEHVTSDYHHFFSVKAAGFCQKALSCGKDTLWRPV